MRQTELQHHCPHSMMPACRNHQIGSTTAGHHISAIRGSTLNRQNSSANALIGAIPASHTFLPFQPCMAANAVSMNRILSLPCIKKPRSPCLVSCNAVCYLVNCWTESQQCRGGLTDATSDEQRWAWVDLWGEFPAHSSPLQHTAPAEVAVQPS